MDSWVSVHWGSFSQVLVFRTLLEAHGIPTLLEDEVLKGVDPAIVGAPIFSARLLVPRERAAEAARILEQPDARTEGYLPGSGSRTS